MDKKEIDEWLKSQKKVVYGSPDYHRIYLNHDVKSYGVRYPDGLYCDFWYECSCVSRWSNP